MLIFYILPHLEKWDTFLKMQACLPDNLYLLNVSGVCLYLTFLVSFFLVIFSIFDKKYCSEVWSIIVVNLCSWFFLFIFSLENGNTSLYLPFMSSNFYSYVLNIIFLIFLLTKKKTIYRDDSSNLSFLELLQKYARRPEYSILKHFWTHTFFQRKQEKLYILVLEVPILIVATFYCFIITNLFPFVGLHTIRCAVFYIGYKSWSILFLSIIPSFLLTVLFSIPSVHTYIRDLYGGNVLKEIGWENPVSFSFKLFLVFAKGIGSCIFIGKISIVFDDFILSPILNRLAFTQRLDLWVQINDFWSSHNLSKDKLVFTKPLWEHYKDQKFRTRLVDSYSSLYDVIFSKKK